MSARSQFLAVRRLASLASLASCALAAPVTAQEPGLPVYHSPAHLPVRGVLADFGIGAGYAGTGRLLSYGGRLQSAFDAIQIFAGVHGVSPDADGLGSGIGLEAAIAWRLLEPRPRRVANLQVGVAWTDIDATGDRDGITFFDVPLSASLGAYLPTPAGPAEAWIAPRVHLRHTAVDTPDFEGGTYVGPGLSAGLRFTTAAPQLGGSIAVDGLGLKDPATDSWRLLTAVSLTVHWLLLR